MTLLGWGRKVLLLAIIPVPLFLNEVNLHFHDFMKNVDLMHVIGRDKHLDQLHAQYLSQPF